MARWAIIGTGFISHTVIDAIASVDGSTVEVIAGRNPERVAEFCEQHGVTRGETDFAAVLADPAVDVVYIGLPNHAHHDLALAAAAAGKPVLSEKSLTTTMATAHELVAGVRGHGTFFVEGLMYLAHPLYRWLLEFLESGQLGDLRSVNGRYAANIWQVVNPGGMGTLYNLGCYPVSLLHLVVQACCGQDAFVDRTLVGAGNLSEHDGNVVDAAVTIRFGNGVLASLQSTDSYGNSSDFSITGTAGVLRFATNPWLPDTRNELIFTPFDGETQNIAIDDAHDAFHHQILMVEDCIANGATEAERPSPRLQDSIEIMEVLTEWEAICRV
jgi:predicted dehydrogenase